MPLQCRKWPSWCAVCTGWVRTKGIKKNIETLLPLVRFVCMLVHWMMKRLHPVTSLIWSLESYNKQLTPPRSYLPASRQALAQHNPTIKGPDHENRTFCLGAKDSCLSLVCGLSKHRIPTIVDLCDSSYPSLDCLLSSERRMWND